MFKRILFFTLGILSIPIFLFADSLTSGNIGSGSPTLLWKTATTDGVRARTVIVPLLTDNGDGSITLDWTTGGSGTPGGLDTYVQFNDGGVFGGDSGFIYDKTSNTATVDIVNPTVRIDIGSSNFSTISKDVSNNLLFYDTVTGFKTLAQLAAGTGTTDHAALSNLNWSAAGHTFDTALNTGSQNIITTGTATSDVVDTKRVESSSGQLTFNDTVTGVKTLAELSNTGTVTTLNAGTGVTLTPNPITTTGTVSIGQAVGTTDSPTFANLSVTNTATANVVDTNYLESGSGTTVTVRDNLTINGDATILGDDLFMATNTSGYILVADGTNYNPVALSGDASLSNTGVLAVNKTRLNVRNETGVQIVSTRAVYASGFNNLPLISLSDNTDEAKHDVLGLTIAPINHEANGFIATTGQCDAETNTWVVGTTLYLSTSGTLTSTLPTSGAVKIIGIVTVQANYPTGKILIAERQEEHILAGGANTDVIIRTGDAIGVNKASFRDYANAEVAFIDSNGVINSSPLTASEILITDASKNIVSAPVATYPSLTELSYVKGLSSAIQTQLGTKAVATTTMTIAGTANQITSSAGAQDLSTNRTWTLSLPADVLIPTILTVPNTGLHLLDTNASHDLIIKPGSDLTADKTLTITTGDTDMIFNLTAVTDEYVLAYDITSNTWRGVAVAPGGGASTALDNLASVAINETLVSDTNNTDDLGTTGIKWKNLYLSGSATSSIVDTQYLEYSTGSEVTIRDALNVNGNISNTGITTINQSADNTGLIIKGYDDRSISNLYAYIHSSGAAVIHSDTGYGLSLYSGGAGTDMELQSGGGGLVELFSGTTGNESLTIYGYDAGTSTTKTGGFLVDAAGTFSISNSAGEDIGFTPGGTVFIKADKTGLSGSQANSHLSLRGSTTATKELTLGYDTTSNFGYVQARDFGNSYDTLKLQPLGGNVDFTNANTTTAGTATANIVDTQYIDYSTGGNVTVRDGLTVNGAVTANNIAGNKTIQFTIAQPSTLVASDLFPIWSNESGKNFTISSIKGWSDAPYDVFIKQMASDGTSVSTVSNFAIATAGTSIFTGTTSSASSSVVANTNVLYFDASAQTNNEVKITISGTFN